MHPVLRRALCAIGLTGGAVLLGIGLADAASADDSGPTTTGESGILSGNQTGVGAQAPVNLSGNQVTVIGQDNHASSSGTSTSSASSTPSTATTSGKSGIGSGNQTGVDAKAPVNASGNQVTVIGQNNTVGGGTSPSGSSTASGGSGGGTATTSGQSGIGSGNQTGVGVLAPINVSGNQVTVIGQDNTASGGGSSSASGGSGGGTATTSGQNGIGSGNQTGVAVLAPVNASGNQVTVIGQDNTASGGGSSSASGGSGGGTATTSGESGLVSGNQTGLGVLAPINLSGNQVTAIGQDNTLTSTGSSTTGGSTGGTTPGNLTTSGQDGLISGNQTVIGVLAPINLSGNQVTVIGQDNTLTSTGSSTTGGSGGTTGGGLTTSGQDGIGSGNQTPIDVLVPVNGSGNQVTVIGQDNTLTSTGGSTTGGTTGGDQTTSGAGGGGSGNQTPVVVQVPVNTTGNQVTVIGQGNTTTSTGGSTSGGGSTGTPSAPGGTVTPPGSVSSPAGGSGSQAAGNPVAGSLPNTGAASGLLGFGLLGLLLLLLGSALSRRSARVGEAV